MKLMELVEANKQRSHEERKQRQRNGAVIAAIAIVAVSLKKLEIYKRS